MTDKDDLGKATEDQSTESQENIESLKAQLTESQDKIKVLEKQLASTAGARHVRRKATLQQKEKLENDLENLIIDSKDKIKDLLIRAKYVEKKGFRLQTNIVMKTTDDKTRDRLANKLEAMINKYEDAMKTLIVSALHVKDKGFWVRVNIAWND